MITAGKLSIKPNITDSKWFSSSHFTAKFTFFIMVLVNLEITRNVTDKKNDLTVKQNQCLTPVVCRTSSGIV